MHVGLLDPGNEAVNDATIRAQEIKCATNIQTKLTVWESKLYIFGDNHGRDMESRQLPNIMSQGGNHGNHGDREFVIYIHP